MANYVYYRLVGPYHIIGDHPCLVHNCLLNQIFRQLGSVAGPVIHANGRLTFEDNLRSEGPET